MVVAQVPPGDPATALDDLRAELDNLTAEFPAARLVVYPEYHTCRVHGNADERRRRYEAIAEPLNGPRVQELRDIAKAANIWLMPGTVAERGADRRIYNTALAITPDGDLAAAYRKIFPWRPFEPFTPGDRFVVFDLPGVGALAWLSAMTCGFPRSPGTRVAGRGSARLPEPDLDQRLGSATGARPRHRHPQPGLRSERQRRSAAWHRPQRHRRPRGAGPGRGAKPIGRIYHRRPGLQCRDPSPRPRHSRSQPDVVPVPPR